MIKKTLDIFTRLTTFAWRYFTTFDVYQTAGDISSIRTDFEGQVGVKIGSTTARGVFYLAGTVSTKCGKASVRLMCHSPGNFNYEIKRWRYDSGTNDSTTLRFPITCILGVAKE